MSLFDECVDQNLGIHPATQLQAAFFVPTPPTDTDLLLFSSASSFSPPDGVPLSPWLSDLAVLSLGGAVAAGEKLRRAVSLSARARDPYPPLSSPPPPSNDHSNGQALVTPVVEEDQAAASRSGDAQAPATGRASDKGADLGEVLRRAPLQRNQVVARGLKSVDDLIVAWEDGWKGYAPMKGFLRGAGGKLDKAQVNLLSKGNTVMKKIQEMGREEFRSTYEVSIGGKVPTLFSIRTRIERENGRGSVRCTKRGHREMTTT